MEEERNYDKLIFEAKKLAFLSMRNFLKKIDLDDNLFNHLYETKVKIDYTEDITNGECSTYDPNSKYGIDTIYLGIDYLDDMYNLMATGISKNSVIFDIANSIVHELIHKCRLVTLKEEVTPINAKDKIFQNAEIYHDLCKKIRDYDDVLALSLLKEKSKSKYIPIKVEIYRKRYYTFVGYNKKSRCFDEFNKQWFDAKYDGDLEKFMLELADEASILKKHLPDNSYKSMIMNDKTIYNAMDLYTLDLDGKNINTKQKAIDKLTKIKYFVDYQEILEESVTEVLSNIILLSRNKENLNLEEICNKIKRSNVTFSNKSAANFIEKGGLDIVKSFILAPYEEEFRNVFYDYYKEDLDKVLSLYGKLDENPKDLNAYNEIDDITDKRLVK